MQPIKEIPSYYQLCEQKEDGESYRFNGLVIIWSIDTELDGKNWLHVSFSRKSRIPDYLDITRTKRDFIGDDRKAIMIFSEKENHVNLHPYCLHLWCCLDGDGLPDFTQGKRSI